MADELKLLEHHLQKELCTTRPAYRQGRKLTAVKVYTINDESRYLIIYGVPSLKLQDELKRLLKKYGNCQVKQTNEYPTEQFTENYQVLYENIKEARKAKRELDNKNFYGGLFHVCYAPELETLSDTRQKLIQRKKEVRNRIFMNARILNDDDLKSNSVSLKRIATTDINCDSISPSVSNKKIKVDLIYEKQFTPCFVNDKSLNKKFGYEFLDIGLNKDSSCSSMENSKFNKDINSEVLNKNLVKARKSDINTSKSVDLNRTNVDNINSTRSNVRDCLESNLNIASFGNEDVRKVPNVKMNKICFHIKRKLL